MAKYRIESEANRFFARAKTVRMILRILIRNLHRILFFLSLIFTHFINYSVREGMKANPRAWEKCTMFVQDIQSPSINITAELTEEEVDSFKQICKLFISFKLHEKNIDEYVSKMPKISATSSCRSLKPNHALSPEKINTERSQSAVNATKNFSDEPTAKDPIPDVIPKQKMIPTHIEPHPGFTSSTPQKLPKSVDINKISRFIKIGAIDFIFRTLERISFEEDIVGLLVRNLKAYDSKLEAMAFGSSTFGFGGCHTDVNILVSTGIAIIAI